LAQAIHLIHVALSIAEVIHYEKPRWAIAINLWNYIKENPKQLLKEPAKPEPSKYKTSISIPIITTSTIIKPAA